MKLKNRLTKEALRSAVSSNKPSPPACQQLEDRLEIHRRAARRRASGPNVSFCRAWNGRKLRRQYNAWRVSLEIPSGGDRAWWGENSTHRNEKDEEFHGEEARPQVRKSREPFAQAMVSLQESSQRHHLL